LDGLIFFFFIILEKIRCSPYRSLLRLLVIVNFLDNGLKCIFNVAFSLGTCFYVRNVQFVCKDICSIGGYLSLTLNVVFVTNYYQLNTLLTVQFDIPQPVFLDILKGLLISEIKYNQNTYEG